MQTTDKSELHALFLSGQSEKSSGPTGALGRVPRTMPKSYDKNIRPGPCTSALPQVQGEGTEPHLGLIGRKKYALYCGKRERSSK